MRYLREPSAATGIPKVSTVQIHHKATMTRVLLTGGSGFIAAHVLEKLLKNGYEI